MSHLLDICWVIAVYIVYSQLFNYGVNIVLLAHNYHIIGSFVCRDQNIIGMKFMKGVFGIRSVEDLAFR